MSGQNFSVHGTLHLWIEDDILMMEGTGPWNLESVNESDDKVLELKPKLYGQAWAALLIVHGDPIYVPEAADIIVDSVRDDIENGRVATAILLNHCHSPEFGRRHLTKIYTDAGETFAFFDEICEAKTWLSTKLEQAKAAS